LAIFNKLRKISAIFRRPLYVTAITQRVAAAIEHEAVLQSMNCKTIVDIGANRGQFALVSRYCFPNAKTYSFEPLREPARVFQRVFHQDNLTSLHLSAIGRKKETAKIHVSLRDDSSSLLPITSAQSTFFQGTAESHTTSIEIAPLDNFLDKKDIVEPALLKIDVQGYELKTLQGCERLISYFQYVYVECSFVELYAGQALADEVIAYLRERGFYLSGVFNMCYDRCGMAVQADFLFNNNATDKG